MYWGFTVYIIILILTNTVLLDELCHGNMHVLGGYSIHKKV